MHIKLADTAVTAPNEILYQMISYLSEIPLFVENWDVNVGSLHFTIDPISDIKNM
jgi:hypothetical protein